MPGVPSGRGCEACRKQKKKVRRAPFGYLDASRLMNIVQSSEAVMFQVCSIGDLLQRQRSPAIQVHGEAVTYRQAED